MARRTRLSCNNFKEPRPHPPPRCEDPFPRGRPARRRRAQGSVSLAMEWDVTHSSRHTTSVSMHTHRHIYMASAGCGAGTEITVCSQRDAGDPPTKKKKGYSFLHPRPGHVPAGFMLGHHVLTTVISVPAPHPANGIYMHICMFMYTYVCASTIWKPSFA